MNTKDGDLLWKRPENTNNYNDNSAYLQQNGNIVIFDKNMKQLWVSVLDILGVCQGGCQVDENCGSGLKCFEQSLLWDEPNEGSEPSSQPSLAPSDVSSSIPSTEPSDTPSDVPTLSAIPSVGPSSAPSDVPSDTPSNSPSTSSGPTSSPSYFPSLSNAPSSQPSNTNVPGCVGLNDGSTNYCISADAFDDDDFPQNKELRNIGTTKNEYLSRTSPLSLCEGHCESNTNCGPGLICQEPDSQGQVKGCSGISSNEDWKYCTYPALEKNQSNGGIDIFNSVNDSFLRIDDTGILKVYSKSQGLLWDSKDGVPNPVPDQSACTSTNCGFDPDHDISITTTRDIVFAGNYDRADLVNEIVESTDSGLSVSSQSIKVKGTISKAYEFVSPLRVTAGSEISFRYELGDGVLALGLCADDRTTPKVPGDGRVTSSCLALGGTSIGEVFTSYFEPKEEEIVEISGNYTKVEVKLSKMFPSQKGRLMYLGIIQVLQENFLTDSYSYIEGVKFLEASGGRRKLQGSKSDFCICDATKLASTLTPGLHHTCKTNDDFCTSARNILTEITRNENESCSSNLECRSGVCDDVTKVCKSTVRFSILFLFSIFVKNLNLILLIRI